jgi:hypothetical protein
MYDLCVIGAGMSGISAAIVAASEGLSVLLIEKNKKIGSKIYATGNGKCNLTNKYIDTKKHYNSSDDSYDRYLKALYGDSNENVGRVLNTFFERIGLVTYTDAYGYVYPASNQASSVVWAMKDALEKANATVITGAVVKEVSKDGPDFTIVYEQKSGETESVGARRVLMSCGGRSYAKLGGSMYGYELARNAGHSVTDIYPALCGLKTDSTLHSADGVRVRTTVRLMAEDEPVDSSTGEVQITDYGVSGIAVFNLSSKAVRCIKAGKHVELQMNLLENICDKDFDKDTKNLLVFLKNAGKGRTVLSALNGITNEKLAMYALEKQHISIKTMTDEITDKSFSQILSELIHYRCNVIGSNDFDKAQVTAGGVRLNEVDMQSFESKLLPGLYIAGELLDIDGICGGYNITFAIMSGITAAEQVNISIKEKQ